MNIADTFYSEDRSGSNAFKTLWTFLKPNKNGEGGSKKFNNGTIWDEMGQNRTNFMISGGFVTLFVTPKNDPKKYAYIDKKSLRVIA